MAKPFQTYKRLNAPHAAGQRAIRMFVCTRPTCELSYEREPPMQCRCGGIEFERFDSKTEMKHWFQLRMLEKRGKITNLKRQIPFALYAYGPGGVRVKVGTYISDFTWLDSNGAERTGDSKPEAGVDDLAALKLRIMEAMGRPVTLLTRNAGDVIGDD